MAIEGIAVRDRPGDVGEFLQRNGDPYDRIGLDDQAVLQVALGSSGVPESFLIDGKGIIRAQHIGEIREKWRAFRPANQHVIQVMHAENFDPAEARAAIENANQRLADLRAAVQETLMEIAQKVSPEGRRHIRVPGGP